MDKEATKATRKRSHSNLLKWSWILLFWIHVVESNGNRVTKSTKEALLEHVWREINRGGDPVSVPTTRHYEIYSKMTGNRVQMRGRRVDANGVAGSKRAKFSFESQNFGGNIMIRNVASGRYLCMNQRGRLVGRRLVGKKSKRVTELCVFTETLAENYYDLFRSFTRPEWYVGFRRNGKPKLGRRTAAGQEEVMLLKMSLDVRPTRDRNSHKQRFAAIAERLRSEFLRGRLPHPTQLGHLTSGGRMLVDSPLAVEEAEKAIASGQEHRKRNAEEEIEVRRTIASFLTNETDITMPPRPASVSATSPEWSGLGKAARTARRKKGGSRKKGKKRKKNRRRRKNKSRGRARRRNSARQTTDAGMAAKGHKRSRQERKTDLTNYYAGSDSARPFSGQEIDALLTTPASFGEPPSMRPMLEARRTKATGPSPRASRTRPNKSRRTTKRQRGRKNRPRGLSAKT